MAAPEIGKVPLVSPSCDDLYHCRKLTDIIWSCGTTIFACTWLSIHPNIPYPSAKQGKSILQKVLLALRFLIRTQLPLFLVALVVPEYILAWAIQQRAVAGRIAQSESKFVLHFVDYAGLIFNGEGWTRAHGFWVIMGGFHAFQTGQNQDEPPNPPGFWRNGIQLMTRKVFGPQNSNQDTQDNGSPLSELLSYRPCYPLRYSTVRDLHSHRLLPVPTEEDIQDHSKSDWLAKTIVLIQTSWFVIQCVARGFKHLAITKLEIVTLAYTIILFVIYVAWWDKPRNVDRPIRVLGNHQVPNQGQVKKKSAFQSFEVAMRNLYPGGQPNCNVETWTSIPIFYSGDTERSDRFISYMTTLFIGIIFGGVHCIAWSFNFPSPLDHKLWRIASASMVIIPAFILITIGLSAICWAFRTKGRSWVEYQPGSVLGGLFIAFLPFFGLVYVAARIITLYLALKTLISLPPSAYQTVPWTTLLLHG
jgi:hypothetical protein